MEGLAVVDAADWGLAVDAASQRIHLRIHGWSRGRRSQTVGADCLTVCHPRDRQEVAPDAADWGLAVDAADLALEARDPESACFAIRGLGFRTWVQ